MALGSRPSVIKLLAGSWDQVDRSFGAMKYLTVRAGSDYLPRCRRIG
jgi:hypothetical protein